MIRTVALIAMTMLLLSPSQVMAQEMVLQPNGDTVMDQLGANCDSIRSTLRRLHTNDALLRVNLGQTYSALSSQLMAKLNSRLALNLVDSSKLVSITGSFEQHRSEFRSQYNEYEAALSSLMKIDCSTRPVEFYAALIATRDAREKLSTTTQSINDDIRDYQVAVEQLQQSLRGAVGDDNAD